MNHSSWEIFYWFGYVIEVSPCLSIFRENVTQTVEFVSCLSGTHCLHNFKIVFHRQKNLSIETELFVNKAVIHASFNGHMEWMLLHSVLPRFSQELVI